MSRKTGNLPEINEWKMPNGKYFGQTLYGTYLLNVSFTGKTFLLNVNLFTGTGTGTIADTGTSTRLINW